MGSRSQRKATTLVVRLNDGTAFEIYKRYCDRDDIARWAQKKDVKLRIEHFGPAFYAVSGVFGRMPGGYAD